MGEILTSAQMRAIERTAIQAGRASGVDLMERAGRGVVAETFREFPDLEKCKGLAVVLCGPGNNGGDGFVIARALRAKGWDVEVFFWGKADALSDDARAMYDAWGALGRVTPMTPEAAGQGVRPTLLFDAMFGIGINRPIPEDCARAFQAVCARPSGGVDTDLRVIAVDCPSGLDSDSGRVLVPDFPDADAGMRRFLLERTDFCVTFHRLKVGHCLNEIGRRWPAVVDIGLPSSDIENAAQSVPPVVPLREWLGEVAGLGTGGHKYDRGHVLVLGGGRGKGGAGRLAAQAALRVGAGLVTLAVPPEAMAENAAQLTAIMLQEMDGTAGLERILSDTRLGVVCMGPGLGVGAATRDLVLAALRITAQDGRRMVLDADALSSFADDPHILFDSVHDGVIMTPHEGEFARLFPDLSEKTRGNPASNPAMSKVEAAATAASRFGGALLLKGEATVLADAAGRRAIHSALYGCRAPWLGTAGAGDVLAGLIAGLAAHQKAKETPLIDIAAAAAWLHVEAARSFGPGLIAEDLPEQLPKVFREIGF